MKILVTGGAGYIGNVLVEQLLENHYVTVIDNLLYKQPCLIEHCHNKKFNFVYGDVRNHSLFRPLIQKNDIIIHLAAYVGMPACNKYPNEADQVNYQSSKFITENTSKDQFIIYPNTNSGYGIGQTTSDGISYCTEETPLNPISLYGKTKCEAEKVFLNNRNATVLRLATVFGVSKRMRLDLLVNDFTYKAFTDKYIVLFESHFQRNYVHIRDVSDVFEFCVKYPYEVVGNVFNVGNTSINMSKMELCKEIKKHIPDFCIMESDINKDPDQRNYIVSNKKIENLGWKCQHSLTDGIEELIKAFSIIKNVNTKFTNI